jgi:competence protein ComEC
MISTEGGNLTVYFLDVGQGDSEFITSPSGYTMLIDAGPTGSGKVIENDLNALGENKQIDYIVATHPHEDHIGGMSTILNDYTIGTFLDSGYPHTTVTYTNILKTIGKKGIVFTTPHSKDIIDFDPGVKTTVMSPEEGKKYGEINDYSIVIKMVYHNVSFLFMGDAQEDVENTILLKGYDVHSTVLKVGHHGSDTSSGIAFLQSVHPKVSVIEVGTDNNYGHPKQTTLGKLALVGSDVYRTDRDGIITITTNGDSYAVTTSK